MKKIYIGLILLISSIMLSCTSNTKTTDRHYNDIDSTNNKTVERVEERIQSDIWLETRIQKKWFEGHSYLVMNSGVTSGPVTYNTIYTITHNPDCPCFKIEKQKSQETEIHIDNINQ